MTIPGDVRLEGRDGEIYRGWLTGTTQGKLGEKFGISQERVSDIVTRVQREMPAPDRAVLISEHLEQLRLVRERAFELVEMAGVPVFVGKDGTMAYDEHGEPVRDYSLRLRALDTAMKAMNTEAVRLGLDAAQKVESTATVRFQLEGIDVAADLT